MIKDEPWIQLVNGKAFRPYNCTKEDIDINVIAHALSNICRFNGHTNRFYSVAEHSVHVSNLLPDDLKIYGLLHDAHEAYTGYGDVCNPVKTSDIRLLEQRVDWAIALHFGLDILKLHSEEVKYVDMWMLATEKKFLLSAGEREWDVDLPEPLEEPYLLELNGSPEIAKENFLNQFNKLMDKI